MRPLLALLLAACGSEPAPLGPVAATDTGASADGTDGTDGTDGGDGTDVTVYDPPYDEDLIEDGGFERTDLEVWSLDAGCSRASDSAGILPHDGDRFLSGGRGEDAGDCVCTQTLDLLARGFDPGAIDAGGVALDLEAWVATHEPPGPYGDQVLVQVRYLDAGGAPLGSLETLIGASVDWELRGASGLLPAGTRALSVEVEGRFRDPPDNDAYADDVSVRLRAVDARSPALTLAPLLQDHRQDAMRVAWETDGNLAWSAVEAGASDALAPVDAPVRTIAVDDAHYVHVVDIPDLSPGAEVAYRVRSGDTVSEVHIFHTAPADSADAVLLGWLSDNQEGWERFRTHLSHLSARAPDLLVVPGDIVYDHDNLVEWREWWWGPLVDVASFGSTTPVLIARGNHDRHHPYGYAYAQVPGNGVFYSYRYGPVFVVTLDSQILPDHLPSSLNQREFLERELASEAARTAAFRVVTFHHGPFTNAAGNDSTGNEGAREFWVPALQAGGVDLVVTGHYHSYQRGTSEGGITYVTVGGGGSTLLWESTDNWDWMDVVDLTWQYSTMRVEGDRLLWETFDLDDVRIDAFELTGGPL